MLYSKFDYGETRIGGKAKALARLSVLDVNIPPWAVVVDDTTPDEIEAFLAQHADDTLFAVRSSASAEDSQASSFAGQFESFLNVPKGDIAACIERVRESVHSERVQVYTDEHGNGDGASIRMAVLLQTMVAADVAGVAFAVNPVTGNTRECLISAVAGLGDKLVDGTVDGETYVVQGEHVSGSGLLTHEQARAIAELTQRVSHFWGLFQDIEWAYHDNTLYLLQSRPITTLRQFTHTAGPINIWDNSNIAESYNGVTTPLTFSFIRMAYEHIYREMSIALGVPAHKIEENQDIFSHMLGLHDGQVYYNLLSWYKLVSLLPGYKTNQRFMEQMMGVKEDLPPHVRALLPEPSDKHIFSVVRKLYTHHRKNPRRVAQFHALLDATLDGRNLSAMSLSELADYYRELERRLLKKWQAPVINDFFSMIFYGLLKQTSASWCGLADENAFNGLLRHSGDIISAEPARLVKEIAELICDNRQLVSAYTHGSLPQIVALTPPDIKTHTDAYLAKFGDRCINELKLESETLHDNPLTLYRAIGHMAVRLATANETQETATDSFNENTIISRCPVFKRPIYRWILKHARATIINRENLRFERTRVFGTVRQLFKHMGIHLASFGVIDQASDVFYLEYGEVLAYIDGTATTQNLRGLIALRKQEYAQCGELDVNRFETYDSAYLSHRHTQASVAEPLSADTLSGLGCCPGVVTGIAKVVINPKDAVVAKGEILIAKRTDPGWIMLFPSAAAIAVEYGSLLSHTAIVSREMGIPAVVSVKGLMERVQTGDLIELDGEKGTVRIIPKRS